MTHKESWLFPQTITDAKTAQNEMASQVLLSDTIDNPIRYIAGMDVSNTPFDPKQMIFGAAVVLSYPSLTLEETSARAEKQIFPYIPGLLGFREVPILVHSYRQLSIRPDLIFVDGHGTSHPRGLGVATHLGVLLDIPTIGVAKSILVGEAAGPLSESPGSTVPLLWKGKEIGMLLRSKRRASPLIISTGHKVSLPTAVQLVLHCLKGYKLPEPTRQAHLFANKERASYEAPKIT